MLGDDGNASLSEISPKLVFPRGIRDALTREWRSGCTAVGTAVIWADDCEC